MRAALSVIFLSLGLLCHSAASSWAAPPSIDFELATEEGFPIGGEREWIDVLKKLDVVGIRIRQAGPGEQPEIKNRGTERSPRYLVVGLLSDRNTLTLPGGKFSLSDRRRIGAWIEKLRGGGEDELYAERGAFGLTAKELVEVHDKLAVAVAFSTQDQPAADTIRRIADSVVLDVEIDPAAQRALAASGPLSDELKGLSSGAALAIALRPAGLVMTVKKSLGNPPKLLIVVADQAEETWPIGWPVEESLREAMPKMLTFLSIQINDIPLSDALAALSQRVEAPFLFDHNALARQRINPAEIAVSLPQGRTFYKSAIDKLLFQARLKGEIRLDEADKPFLWITTLKQ